MLSFLEINHSINIIGSCGPRGGCKEGWGSCFNENDTTEALSVDGISVPITSEPKVLVPRSHMLELN